MTCCNIGCYYTKVNLPRAALKYLGRSIQVEEAAVAVAAESAEHSDAAANSLPALSISLAKTKLNACTALAGIGNHVEARRMAEEALELLLDHADQSVLDPGGSSCSASLARDSTGPQKTAAEKKEEAGLLAVACYNLGAAQEHLGLWSEVAVTCRQGAQIAARTLGARNPLALQLAMRCQKALAKAAEHPVTPDRPAIPLRSPGRLPRPWPRPGGAVLRPSSRTAWGASVAGASANEGKLPSVAEPTVTDKDWFSVEPNVTEKDTSKYENFEPAEVTDSGSVAGWKSAARRVRQVSSIAAPAPGLSPVSPEGDLASTTPTPPPLQAFNSPTGALATKAVVGQFSAAKVVSRFKFKRQQTGALSSAPMVTASC
eukprot:TRINITY_DN37069_c0_g1_i1.p1 TRINITY_DN37069_c0_g1~~TRINITY_DN37069_c0_g1_i1.p1  ORF type:complete len:426 (+),score=68.24 TRINITY_DN37069_c0_g1_i1:160-1278(+)